jgi:protein PhnA
MSLEQQLKQRNGSKCELCGATDSLKVYEVLPISNGGVDGSLLACETRHSSKAYFFGPR